MKTKNAKKTPIEFGVTNRGFGLGKFKDKNGQDCSLQESSIFADEDGACIWFGCDNHEGKIQVLPHLSQTKADALGLHFGWNEKSLQQMYPDCDINIPDRMHLSQKQVKALLPALKHFAKTGQLPI